MLRWLAHLPIEAPVVSIPVFAVTLLLGVYLLWRPRAARRGGSEASADQSRGVRRMVPPRRTVGAALIGAAVGVLACWLAGDVWDAFGIGLSVTTRLWVATACAGVAVAAVNFTGSRARRVVAAGVAIPVFLVAAAVGINVDFGAYPNVAYALGGTPYRPLAAAQLGHAAADVGATPTPHSPLAAWRPDHPLAAHGTVGTVDIPGVVSHFQARHAVVYLPPAAVQPDAPRLPVIIALSGQPGSPSDMFVAGHMPEVLDAYARRHDGIAPIVVVPDELGVPGRNPMCVDSPLGDVATYLTVDVPRWIHEHLKATPAADGWGIVGFSAGGTCAIQLAAAHPHLFRALLDISGEVAPTMGPDTVQAAFGGSQAAYDAAKPAAILAAHAPYSDTPAIFAVGGDDARYTAEMHAVERAARRAGMRTSTIVSPGTAHDWNTVQYAIRRGLPTIADDLLATL